MKIWILALSLLLISSCSKEVRRFPACWDRDSLGVGKFSGSFVLYQRDTDNFLLYPENCDAKSIYVNVERVTKIIRGASHAAESWNGGFFFKANGVVNIFRKNDQLRAEILSMQSFSALDMPVWINRDLNHNRKLDMNSSSLID